MKISNSNFTDFYKFTQKNDKSSRNDPQMMEARKNDPKLDRQMYLNDISEAYREMAKTEEIAHKVAKGESLSAEERKYLEEKNPELLRKSEQAKQQGDNLREQLKSAKSKEEAQQMIGAAMQKVDMTGKYDKVGASLLNDAFLSAVKEYNNDQDSDSEKNKF